MRRINRFALCVFVSLCSVNTFAQRTVNSLDFGWKFQAGDVQNGAAVNLDDSNWRTVNLPHDFQIEQPWVEPAADERPDNTDVAANIKSRLSSRGFKEMGKGWYRLHLTPDETWKNKRIVLDFGGIMYVGEVYLNGNRIGGTDYGYVDFGIDITNELKWGQDNVIAVMADTREPNNSRWYTGGGLFRSVKLITSDKTLYFERHPLNISTRDNRFVNIQAEFTNRGKEKETTVGVKIYAPDGMLIAEGTSVQKRITMSRTMEAKLPEMEVKNAQLWDCEHPNLYKAVVTLQNEKGEVVDETSSNFGIRTVEIIPNKGLLLNGKKVLLKGFANHHSLGALGAAAYPRAIEKRIQMVKEWGINHIRTSHNPYSREFIELCDKYGILVVDELYDKWTRQHTGGKVPFEQLWQQNIPEWVKRDRNSPSVVMWSLGNELQQDPNQPFNDFGVTMYKLMKTLINRYDSTRLVTVAMHPRYRNWETDSLPADLAMITDVQSYNYRYMYFPGDGRRFPWMKFYQSEASVSAMGENYFAMDLDKVIGMAYWGMIDYLGESQGWPAKGWMQGVFDITLEPKPKAYYMKSFFKPEEPLVHIAVIDKKGDMMWNGVQTGNDGMSDHWNRQQGSKVSLITYTNADEVELFVNGKSMGVKQNDKKNAKMRNQIRWDDIPYANGYCEAVAKNNGKIVARHKIVTTGDAVKLIAIPDNDNWKADGMDLQHVRVYAVDKKGRRVYHAQQQLTFNVSEGAEIVAVSNGDQNSEELNVTNQRRLYNGSALVILRSNREAANPVLTISGEGFKTVKSKLITK